jgi:hypothetical protein
MSRARFLRHLRQLSQMYRAIEQRYEYFGLAGCFFTYQFQDLVVRFTIHEQFVLSQFPFQCSRKWFHSLSGR